MTYYTGITIGPIYETMQLSNKLESVWLSSYIFSKFSKLLQDELKKKYKIAFPCYEQNHIDCFEKGIGLFDDRIILFDKVNEKDIYDAKSMVCLNIAKDFDGVNDLKIDDVNNILIQYIQLGIVCKDIADDKNIINEFDSDLAIADLDRRVVDNALSQSFDKFKQVFSSGKTFKVDNKNYNCASYVKKNMGISTTHKLNTIFDHYDPESKKPSQYYACICADGDNFSKYLDTIVGYTDELINFSKHCFDFNLEVEKIIEEYGGLSVYQGGDDIFCILPIKNNDKNVFDFTRKLNAKFNEYFKDCSFIERENEKERKKKVSLSMAVSLRYYKYPINEAKNDTTDLLYSVVKNNRPNKNSTLFNLQKHSGQTYNVIFDNNDDNFDAAVKLFSNVLNGFVVENDQDKKSENAKNDQDKKSKNNNEEEKELHSIKNNIFKFEELIQVAIYNTNKNTDNYLNNLFNNVYDNGPNSKTKDLLDVIKNYLTTYYKSSDKSDTRSVMGAVGILGILNFIGEERRRK